MIDFRKPSDRIAVNLTNYMSYVKAQNIKKNDIEFINSEKIGVKQRHLFSVSSETYYDVYYKVEIVTDEDMITGCACACPEYKRAHSCKHVAAVILNYYEQLTSFVFDPKDRAISIIEDLYPIREKGTKKQLTLSLEFNFQDDSIEIKVRIGDKRSYLLNRKFGEFIDAYQTSQLDLILGKDLIYNSKYYYFNEQDTKIIEYLIELYENTKKTYYTNTYLLIESSKLYRILNLIKDKEFKITDIGSTTNYIVGNPFKCVLEKKEEGYLFRVDFKSAIILTDNYEFAYLNKLYSIPQVLTSLYIKMREYNINELFLTEEYVMRLSKNIYSVIEEKLEIDPQLREKIKIMKPTTKLYLDFKDNIICNLVFDYNGKEVNYFGKDIVNRNEEEEELVVRDLLKCHFVIEEERIIIKELDNIANFLEIGIFELTEKYTVFTSEKVKNTSVIRNNTIKSQFSIGKDNIINYQFDLGNINNNELNKIFESMKSKKQYYKLKSGKIIDIEDDNLKQLQDLMDNLDIDYKNSTGTIPKYRAIYLDSVQYDIVKTDNLFKKFIDNFNLYKNCNIELSEEDDTILRGYQGVGVQWLYNLYKCGFGGVLADEMGLGKSIQTIMFIKQVIKENADAKILIAAPTSLIYNWQHEFDMFGKELNYRVIAENKNKRLEDLTHNFDNSNIFITTYGLLRQDQEQYLEKDFNLVIIDEAQNIKNPKTGISKVVKGLKTNSKFALTGTPVENSVLELWSIFDFVMPGYLNNLSKFQARFNIKDVDKEGKEKLKNLSKIVAPFILRRKKKEVLTELPDKIENNIYLELLPEQKKLYAAQVKKTKQEFEELLKTEGFLKARFKILQLLTKLRQLCIDPSIIFENYKSGSVKIEEVINLIGDAILNGHKILLFTSFKTALEIVREKLKENNIKNYVIDGSVSSKMRNQLVTSFNKDNTPVFLITLKSGGTGLNLTSADIVIHLDLWWNPQVENQATDRAHRIGQKNTVEVIKLICKGTIEEKILELQNKKKVLVDTLIDDENKDENIISNLGEKEIKELLSYSELN